MIVEKKECVLLLKHLEDVYKNFSKYEADLHSNMLNATIYEYNSVSDESYSTYESDLEEESLEAAYRDDVEVIYNGILMLYEIMGLPGKKDLFQKVVEEIRSKQKGKFEIKFNSQWDCFECEVVQVLSREISLISIALGKGDDRNQLKRKENLERSIYTRITDIFKDTGFYVESLLAEAPKTELEIQRVMHVILEGAFHSEFVKRPQVSQPIKNFIPDGGVKSIKTAFEFKFVTSKEEMAKAIEGIYADLQGYSGSEDWKKIVSVIYQTENFNSQKTAQEDILKKSAGKWNVITVTGKGGKKDKMSKPSKKPSP